MQNTSIGRTAFVSLLIGATFISQSPMAFSSECMPGWQQQLDRLRSAQRAHACSGAASFSDCEAMMGLGLSAAAVGTVAVGKGASAVRNAVNRIRDSKFRPCPVSFSYQMFSPKRFSPLRLLGAEHAWASTCTSPMEIHKSQVREALRLVQAEVDENIQRSELALQRMEETEKKLAGLSEKDRAAQIKSIAGGNTSELQREASKAQRAYEDARLRLGYQLDFNDQMNYADKKARDLKNLQRLFQQYVGQPMGEELWNMEAIAERLPPDQQAKFNEARRELKDSVYKEFEARMKIEKIERSPDIARLKSVATSFDAEALRMRNLVSDGQAYASELGKGRSALAAALAEAKKARQTLEDMKDMTEVSKTAADLYAVASRIHNFIPKETLLDPAKKILATTLKEVGALANTLASFEGKVTDAAYGYLAKILPNIAKVAPAMKAVVPALGRVVAFTGGLFVSGISFAANEFDGPCTAMPTSDLFPANPDRGCDRFSLDNPGVQKIAEMDSDAMCALAKQNPDVLQMINTNYSYYYGGMRGQCGDPLRVSSSGWGNASFDGRELTFVPPGQTKPVMIEFDSVGNESGVRLARTRTQTRIEWGEGAPFGRGDELESALRMYKTRILPVLAEAKACCSSGDGIKPDPADCAKWDLLPSGRNGPGRTDRTTR